MQRNNNNNNYNNNGGGFSNYNRNNHNQNSKMNPKNAEITFFVDVPQFDVARIVGRGGVNIRRIQDACHCLVRSPPRDVEPHDDGTVSFQIKGRPQGCFEAYEMIQEDLEEPIQFSAAEINLGHPRDVALLIGPGGSSVKAVMRKSGAKIVTRPREDRSGLVVIEGLPENVKTAHELMVETIENARKEKEAEPYRSSRSVKDAALAGSPSKNAGGASESASNRANNNSNNNNDRNASFSRENKGKMREWGSKQVSKFSGPAPTEPAPPAAEVEPEKVLEMPFPEEKTGAIFGSKGKTINHIKRKSRAYVRVDTTKHIVEIKGSAKAVDIAAGLIQGVLDRKPREAAAAEEKKEEGDDSKPAEVNQEAVEEQEKKEEKEVEKEVEKKNEEEKPAVAPSAVEEEKKEPEQVAE